MFLVWLVGGGVNARYYYRRRHGVLITPGAQGKTAATALSMVWPVALFTRSYRNPELCTHPGHVMRRAANRQQADDVQRMILDERR